MPKSGNLVRFESYQRIDDILIKQSGIGVVVGFERLQDSKLFALVLKTNGACFLAPVDDLEVLE